MAATSGEKSSGVWETLIPTPITRDWTAPVSPSRATSVKMPAIFFWCRIRSLVHLIWGRT